MKKKNKKRKPTLPKRRKLPSPMPAPGLSGDYRGSCVVCLRGTDTGLAVQGEAEVAIGMLAAMGVDTKVAANTIAVAHGCAPGTVPTGNGPWAMRLCGECASTIGVPVGDPRTEGVPCVRMANEPR